MKGILTIINFLYFFSPHDIEILKAEMEKRQPSSPLSSELHKAIEGKEEEKTAEPTNKTDSDTAVAASS